MFSAHWRAQVCTDHSVADPICFTPVVLSGREGAGVFHSQRESRSLPRLLLLPPWVEPSQPLVLFSVKLIFSYLLC